MITILLLVEYWIYSHFVVWIAVLNIRFSRHYICYTHWSHEKYTCLKNHQFLVETNLPTSAWQGLYQFTGGYILHYQWAYLCGCVGLNIDSFQMFSVLCQSVCQPVCPRLWLGTVHNAYCIILPYIATSCWQNNSVNITGSRIKWTPLPSINTAHLKTRHP